MNISPLLLLIVAVNAFFTYKGLSDRHFFEKYLFRVDAVKRGEYYRLITGSFLHGSWTHFFFNMLTLYFFFPVVESFTGTGGALLVYVAGMLAGNVLAYYLNRRKPWYAAVGASGAVNAVVFASILLYPKASIIILPVPVPVPAWLYAIGYLIYTSFGMKNHTGNIGHEAHFGGAAAGLITAALLAPREALRHPALFLILLGVIIAGFFYAQKTQSP